MGIKAVMTSELFDEQPDEIKELYKQTGDKHILDVDGIDDHPKVVNLKSAHEKTKLGLKQIKDAAHGREVDADKIADESVKAAVTRFKSRFDGLPEEFDAEAYQELRAAAEGKGGTPTEEQIAEMRDKITVKLEKRYADKFQPEIEARDKEIAGLRGSRQKLVIDGGLTAAMDAADIDPKFKPMLAPYLKSIGKMRIDEDDDGSLRPVVETDMGNVGLKDWVTEFAGSDDGKQYVMKAEGPNPKGGDRRNITGKTMKRAAFDALDPTQQQKTIQDDVQITD